MGVGSSLIAALMHERRAMGCEREAVYGEIARQRIWDYFNGTLRYRPIGKPVYQPTGQEKVSQIPEEWKEPSHKTEDFPPHVGEGAYRST